MSAISTGRQAAVQFKQVPWGAKHATTVQYSENPRDEQGFADSVDYVRSFCSDPVSDSYTAINIAEAFGFDLTKLPEPTDMEQLLDLNKDGRVNTEEMITVLAHLDSADGNYNGKITENGRDTVELAFGKQAYSGSIDRGQKRLAELTEGVRLLTKHPDAPDLNIKDPLGNLLRHAQLTGDPNDPDASHDRLKEYLSRVQQQAEKGYQKDMEELKNREPIFIKYPPPKDSTKPEHDDAIAQRTAKEHVKEVQGEYRKQLEAVNKFVHAAYVRYQQTHGG